MTKTKNSKKNLTWKLKDLPTAREVKEFVEVGILSKEEAREILLGNSESDKDKIEALEKLVEYLQDLVKELSKPKQTFVPVEKIIYVDRHVRPYWDRYWMQTSKVLNDVTDLKFTSETTSTLKSTAPSLRTVGYLQTGPNAVYEQDQISMRVDNKIS